MMLPVSLPTRQPTNIAEITVVTNLHFILILIHTIRANQVDAIRAIAKSVPEVLLGVGTILTPSQVTNY